MRRVEGRLCWLFVPASFSDSKLVMLGVYMTRHTARTKRKAGTAQIKPPIEVGSLPPPQTPQTTQLLSAVSNEAVLKPS